jgi:hypothetical protein
MRNISSQNDKTGRWYPRIAQGSSCGGLVLGRCIDSTQIISASLLEIRPGETCVLNFKAEEDAPLIFVQLATYQHEIGGELWSGLFDSAGRLLDESRTEVTALIDNKYVLLHDLSGQPLARGDAYSIKIRPPAAAKHSIGIYGDICSVANDNEISRVPIAISIPDRTFIRRPLREADAPIHAFIVSREPNDRLLERIRPLIDGPAELSFVDYARLFEFWRNVSASDIVFFADYRDKATCLTFDAICYALRRSGAVPVAVVDTAEIPSWVQSCRFVLHLDGKQTQAPLFDNLDGQRSAATFGRIVATSDKRRHPAVAIICPLADHAHISQEISTSSSYDVDFVCVAKPNTNGLPKADSIRTAESWYDALCLADHDLIMIVGPGMHVNQRVVDEHVFEHAYDDTEIVCAPICPNRDHKRIPAEVIDLRALSLKRSAARDNAAMAFQRASGDFSKANVLFNGFIRARAVDVIHSATCASQVDGGGLQRYPLYKFVKSHIKEMIAAPALRRNRPLRVLSYRWHAAHQYEIWRLPIDVTLAKGFDNHITQSWPYMERPLRPNVHFGHLSDINPRDYDLCVVHFDENVLCPEFSNGVLPDNWGDPFKWLLSFGHMPKIAVCHGTPAFVGQYALDPKRKFTFEILEAQRQQLVSCLIAAQALVVCNSWQAMTEWGFKDARVIWHGFDPAEFHMGRHRHDVLTLRYDYTRPHYRGTYEQKEVVSLLDNDIEVAPSTHREVPLELRTTNAFAKRQLRSYVDYIGDFKLYLNTTLRSPMPRSRGEAMMTGVIPVSLANHDVERFIDNGIDGFYAETTSELAQFINTVMRDSRALAEMSAAARRKASDVFNIDRFQRDWINLLEDRLGRKIPNLSSS